MGAFDRLSRLFLRFRYPVTLPEDIADALGIDMSNFLTFDELIQTLVAPGCCPTNLARLMPRERAERAFASAQRKERFAQSTLCSYYFTEGWLEFKLDFDSQSQLRRLYIHHQKIPQDRGAEISLPAETKSLIHTP